MVCVLIVEIVEMGCGLEMMGARRGSVDQPDPRVSAQTPPLHSTPGKTKSALTCSRLKTFPAADRKRLGGVGRNDVLARRDKVLREGRGMTSDGTNAKHTHALHLQERKKAGGQSRCSSHRQTNNEGRSGVVG